MSQHNRFSWLDMESNQLIEKKMMIDSIISYYLTYQTAVEKPNQNSTSQSSYIVILNMYNLVCIQQILLLTFSN